MLSIEPIYSRATLYGDESGPSETDCAGVRLENFVALLWSGRLCLTRVARGPYLYTPLDISSFDASNYRCSSWDLRASPHCLIKLVCNLNALVLFATAHEC